MEMVNVLSNEAGHYFFPDTSWTDILWTVVKVYLHHVELTKVSL